ncbi:MAG: BCD family MFS transporter [Pseudomonadota bacterium]
MSQTPRPRMSDAWSGMGTRFLPFADAASETLPLGRLLRLSLFQVSVGMALTLLTGTLNRVMIIELAVPTWLVALMISLPLVFAPLRALIGHKSDTHRSVLGWRRGPYIWFGSLLMFGGLAIMPFALLILSGDTHGPAWIGHAAGALAFLSLGAGLHTVQTAGLALATDIAPEETRPRVVALLYVMLLVGMGLSALVFGWLLSEFSQLQLIRVIQGAAVIAMALNLIALWKQEPRNRAVTGPEAPRIPFGEAWRQLMAAPDTRRLLWAIGLGAAAFSMQDVLLEPYGGEILGMSVSQTTMLTAIFAAGTLSGFGLAAHRLGRGANPHRLAAHGTLLGIVAFSMVVFAAPLQSGLMFRAGAFLIGLGGGLFSVCTLTAAMALAKDRDSGIALGTWGAVHASAMGVALFLGGAIRDVVESLAASQVLGSGFAQEAVGYSVVYHIEIFLLFITLVVIGPLARHSGASPKTAPNKAFGLASFPG